ncbi:hypothetical protein [Alkalihalobacillus sp. AL-G]|uniref:hypothetical protein n=1 Tax=Alkalihalobacillus sp. AL-G TaxID=2926399 RepID=UPI00272AF5BE|nr:hypothetical protein [Alkalihalobacillus sp. AL-G]WLD95278.1 hypothetical protein MOJ78_10510 [Alkalihalobacillus sp. AL-G]
MTIQAKIQPLDISRSKDTMDPFYRQLEIYMQGLGHLVSFKEELNWETPIATIELGDSETLHNFKKRTAKNDGVLLLYAKLTKGTVYQHVILHPNDSGIYLPFRFDEPFYMKIGQKKTWIGSAVRLQEELGWLEIAMSVEEDDEIVSYWKRLRDACRSCVDNVTPMILEEVQNVSE